jgi:hypothetical protein
MTKRDDKAGLPLSQTKLTTNQQQAFTERLSKLDVISQYPILRTPAIRSISRRHLISTL